MPRTYKKKPETRKYASCDDKKPQKASDMITSGASQRIVCAELGITISTLQNKLKKTHMQKSGRPIVLTEFEEKAIAEHLVATSEWVFPFYCKDILVLIKTYLDKQGRSF
ncbi:unnamed protein product [Lymnaea stagnalis]|uniref:Transposase n=1 Tax=Lymnaea stagnalis TaxID=6523 RepID=A0AAV2HZ37_LYMST